MTELTTQKSKEALLVTYLDEEVLTKEEKETLGRDVLVQYLDSAEQHLENVGQEFTAAILDLHCIRENRLYQYGYTSWAECVHTFIEERAVGGRTTVLKAIKIARMWTGGMGRNAEELYEYGDGTKTLAPVLDGPESIVEAYSRETGEIAAVRNGWEDKLPEGKTLGERVYAWIKENVHPGDTASVIRASLHMETPQRDLYSFSVYKKDGRPAEVGWAFELVNGEYKEGRGVSTMPGSVYQVYCQRLGIAPKWR